MSSALVERTTTMTGNKKIMCKVCCREMRSDILERHKKQHLKRNEDNPVTNENKIKDEEFRKALINLGNEYQKKIVQGQKFTKHAGAELGQAQVKLGDIVVIVVAVVVKAMVEVEVQLLFRVGGWSDKTKLILISTLVEVVVEVEVELGNYYRLTH